MNNNLVKRIGIVSYRPISNQEKALQGDIDSLKSKGISFQVYDHCSRDYKAREGRDLFPKLEELDMVYVYALAFMEKDLKELCPKKVVNVTCGCHPDPSNKMHETLGCGCQATNALSKIVKNVRKRFLM